MACSAARRGGEIVSSSEEEGTQQREERPQQLLPGDTLLEMYQNWLECPYVGKDSKLVAVPSLFLSTSPKRLPSNKHVCVGVCVCVCIHAVSLRKYAQLRVVESTFSGESQSKPIGMKMVDHAQNHAAQKEKKER